MTIAVGTLVDSNVLLDVLTEDAVWLGWSANALARAADAGPLFVNPDHLCGGFGPLQSHRGPR